MEIMIGITISDISYQLREIYSICKRRCRKHMQYEQKVIIR